MQAKEFLQEIFPAFTEKMEKATSQEELNALASELIAKARKNLRDELAKAHKDEADFADLLTSDDDRSLPAVALDPVDHDEVINARGNNIKTWAEKLYNTLKYVPGKKSENGHSAGEEPTEDDYRMAAYLVANSIIAVSDKGIQAANEVLKKSMENQAADIATLGDEWNVALADLTEDERKRVSGAAPVLVAALAGVQSVGGAAVLGAIILVLFVVLFVIGCFCAKDAACIIFIVNDIQAPGKDDYDKFNLVYKSAYNIHGKETGYTNKIKSCLAFDQKRIFAVGGFYTTEKRSQALRGTDYGVQFEITDANLVVAFGAESPLSGKNKCYCGFGKTAKEAADAVKANLSDSASSGEYKATIFMNSTSGNIAYYIARVYQ